MDSQDKTPKIWQRALALVCTLTAIASWLYVAAGPGFYRAPWAYTLAWLVFLASAAYAVPMLDVTCETLTLTWRRTKRIARGTRHALAGVRRRSKAPACPRQVRVVRGTAKAKP